MAAVDYTTTGLLASLKRRGMLPSTAETLSTTDFLAIADEELQTYILPLLMGVREEYLVATATPYAQSTSVYEIPPRAIGDKIQDVLILDGTDYRSLSRIEPSGVNNYTSTGDSCGYVLRANTIVLVPAPSAAQTLLVRYFLRPSHLVATTASPAITVINGARTVVTVSAVPSTIDTGLYVDIVDSTPGFQVLSMDNLVTADTGTTVTLTTALPDTVKVGDYLCVAGESPVPQIPVELHSLLSQRVAFKALEALGDPKAALSKAVADEMRVRVLSLLSPRAEGSPRAIINYNGPGWSSRRWR